MGEVALFGWVGLNQSRLPIFFALLKSANLHDFVVFVDKNAEAVWNKVPMDLSQVLAPVVAALVLPILNQVILDEIGLLNENVVHELLEVEDERLVFTCAVVDILIHGGHVFLDLLQNFHLLLDGSLF